MVPAVSFQHPGPFEDAPGLKPIGKVACHIAQKVNPLDGLPMIAVLLSSAVTKQARSRKKKGNTATEAS